MKKPKIEKPFPKEVPTPKEIHEARKAARKVSPLAKELFDAESK